LIQQGDRVVRAQLILLKNPRFFETDLRRPKAHKKSTL
jgi:hypothetical protein